MTESTDNITIAGLWTAGVIEAAAEQGADRDRLWKLSGASPNSIEQRIPWSSHLAVWTAAMHELDDPRFPIAVARIMRVDDYDALGLACKTAANVRDAIELVSRYLAIWTNAYELTIGEGQDSALLTLQSRGSGLGRRCAIESAIAELLGAIRQICPRDIRPRRVHFRHREPADLSAHREFFDAELVFDSNTDALEFSPEALSIPLSLADEGLSRYLVSRLEELANDRAPADSVLERIRRAVGDELPTGNPTTHGIARRIGMSTRSLQRTLAAEGTRFSAVVADTRKELAIQLLTESDRPLAEVAFLLGFSQPSAFHRAFKRWTGDTPASVRSRRADPI